MQVREFLLEVHQPDILDARVLFVVVAAPIQVRLRIFVHDHALEHIGAGVGEAAVPRNVLFLDHRDLRIQFSAEFGVVQVRYVEVIVHRLLFRRRNDGDVQAGDGVVEVIVDIEANVVFGRTRLRNGRPARHDLGIFPDEFFGVDALFKVQQVCIAVQVVEVLQKGKIKLVFDIFILFPLRENGGEVDRELLVTDGMFEDALVAGLQVGDALLLLLFAAADERHIPAHLVVGAVPRKARRVPDRLKFRTVHEDGAHARIRVDRLLIVGLYVDALPVFVGLADVFCAFLKRVHGISSFFWKYYAQKEISYSLNLQ